MDGKRDIKSFSAGNEHIFKNPDKKIPVLDKDSKISKNLKNNLFIDKETCYKILDHIKERNYEAYVANNFMWKTGTKYKATLEAKLENIYKIKEEYFITVYEEKTKPWEKYIPSILIDEIKLLTNYPDNKCGLLFPNIDEEINKKLMIEALETIFPQLLEKYPLLIEDFWRHMFAQHMLRTTEWNYEVVANLGGWDIKSLKESYGKPVEDNLRSDLNV